MLFGEHCRQINFEQSQREISSDVFKKNLTEVFGSTFVSIDML